MARILIAEDQKDIRDLVTLTLEYVGHEVLASPNGEDVGYAHAEDGWLRSMPSKPILIYNTSLLFSSQGILARQNMMPSMKQAQVA